MTQLIYPPTIGGITQDTTLSEFVSEVFWPAKCTLRASTKKGYKRDLNRILPELGNLPLNTIRHLAIQQLLNSCDSTKMAKNARSTLSTVLALACDLEIIDSNYASGRRFRYPDVLPGDKAHDQGVVLRSFDAIFDFLKMLRYTVGGEMLERACLLGLGVGLRRGEIFGLDGKKINRGDRMLSIDRTYVEDDEGWVLLPPKTTHSIRTIPYLGYLERRFAELDIPDGPFVFNGLGERQNPESASKILKKWREHYYMPVVTFGSMRHSFATACVKAGIPIADVSIWLGHSNPTITASSYLKPSVLDLLDDAVSIDERYGYNGHRHSTGGARRAKVINAGPNVTAEEFIHELALASS